LCDPEKSKDLVGAQHLPKCPGPAPPNPILSGEIEFKDAWLSYLPGEPALGLIGLVHAAISARVKSEWRIG
jgi:hypothetical protein